MRHMRGSWLLAPVALLAVLTAGPTPASETSKAPRGKPTEVAEMLWSIVGGTRLGSGHGWFHPAESRYGWNWLADQFDTNGDGKITRGEFKGPPDLYIRLDRTRDGTLTAEEFDWADNSPLARQAMIPNQWFRMFDGDGNGKLSKAEWDALFARAARGKGFLTAEDLRDAFPMTPPVRPPQSTASKPADGPTQWMLFKGLLSGEIGSFHEGPEVGAMAPGFKLKTHDDARQITLSQFRDKKPVVLVFGSFT